MLDDADNVAPALAVVILMDSVPVKNAGFGLVDQVIASIDYCFRPDSVFDIGSPFRKGRLFPQVPANGAVGVVEEAVLGLNLAIQLKYGPQISLVSVGGEGQRLLSAVNASELLVAKMRKERL